MNENENNGLFFSHYCLLKTKQKVMIISDEDRKHTNQPTSNDQRLDGWKKSGK